VPATHDKEVDQMARTTARILTGTALVLGTLVVSVVLDPGAGAQATSAAVAPHQTFFGVVNGSATAPKIVVACPAAVRPHELGHPMSGQTIGVRSPAPSTTPTGSTGARGTSIVAQFATPSATAASSVVFTRYGSKPLPTTLLLPCLGSGTVVFSPAPTSASARSETMTVSYVTPCPGVCADRIS
jgi:hypothetical protein